MEPQPEHELAAGLPQTSQTASVFGGGTSADSADSADECAEEAAKAEAAAAAVEGGRGADVADECAPTFKEPSTNPPEAKTAAATVDGGVGRGPTFKETPANPPRRCESLLGVEDEGTSSVGGDGLLSATAFFPPLFLGMVWVV